MTICIAVIGTDADGKEAIVFATDHMVSISNIGQFDKTIDKYKVLNASTVAMLSGNPLIFNDILKDCNGKDCDFEMIKNTIHKNMIAIKDDIVQKQILDTFKVDMKYVQDVMRGPLQNPYVNSLLQTIATFNLQTSILLIGYKGEEAQIVEIRENLINDFHDIEFGVIGSGSVQAINTLMFQRQSKKDTLSTTLYNVYKAKRNAEVAVGVGKETDIMILTQKGRKIIAENKLGKLSGIYEDELRFGKNSKGLSEVLE